MAYKDSIESYDIEELNERDREVIELADAYIYEGCISDQAIEEYVDDLRIGSPEFENMLIEFLRNFVEWQQDRYVSCRQEFIASSIDAYSYAEQVEIQRLQKGRRNNGSKDIDNYRADSSSRNT